MKRAAFKMQLNPGCEVEYKRRHEEIWPELTSLLKRAGVSDYSIFFDEETSMLLCVLKVRDIEVFERLSSLQVMQKWWDYMSDIMPTNEDKSPVTKMLEEVFYLS
jgi:L-rhamnose mutarotase